MPSPNKPRNEVLLYTHNLFKALLDMYGMHDFSMRLLIELTQKKTDDQEFIDAVSVALDEMVNAGDALEEFQNGMDERIDAMRERGGTH